MKLIFFLLFGTNFDSNNKNPMGFKFSDPVFHVSVLPKNKCVQTIANFALAIKVQGPNFARGQS